VLLLLLLQDLLLKRQTASAAKVGVENKALLIPKVVKSYTFPKLILKVPTTCTKLYVTLGI